MKPRAFVILFSAIVTVVLFFCIVINTLDLPYSDTDILRHYQIYKLNRAIGTVETVILGDSSAGNAIDAKLFGRLSGKKTLNLSLVGGFGFESDEHLMQYLNKKAPKVKNIVIIHTLDIWKRGSDKDIYLDTARYGDRSNFLKPPLAIDYFIHIIKLKRAVLSLKRSVLHEKFPITIDRANDFVVQRHARYSNGLLVWAEGKGLSPLIHPDKKKSYAALSGLCQKENLNCIYLHGPILETAYQNSADTISAIDELVKTSDGILGITDVFHYPEEKMGDSEDHVDANFKKEITKEYWEAVKPYLR